MPNLKDLQYRRTHNLLLIQKLLSGRENASPFTLVLDSLEQSARPLVRYMIRKASAAKTNIIFVSFETLRKPANVDTFIHAHTLAPSALQARLANATANHTRNLLIFDSLSPSHLHTPHFLASLMSPSTSLLGIYHLDVPLSSSLEPQETGYTPHPLTTLKYLATTLLTVHSLHHVLAQKSARDRARPEPLFGIPFEVPDGEGREGEGAEGIVQGLGANDTRGCVVEMLYRRRSGRGVGEWFFVPSTFTSSLSQTSPSSSVDGARTTPSVSSLPPVILLEDHPLYATSSSVGEIEVDRDVGMDTTFELGLTEKQRRDREGVVLPYFDAQGGEGGEGGRILYEMGVEDDFDEEEDEI